MVLISREERKELEKFGLLKYKRVGFHPQDPNFVVVNKEHVGRDKTIYVAEEYDIMAFLQKYDGLNLQKIRKEQVQELKDMGLIKDENIQEPHTYKKGAFIYLDDFGQYRMKKITDLMIALGIWKAGKRY